jgi:hypothetical protein
VYKLILKMQNLKKKWEENWMGEVNEGEEGPYWTVLPPKKKKKNKKRRRLLILSFLMLFNILI